MDPQTIVALATAAIGGAGIACIGMAARIAYRRSQERRRDQQPFPFLTRRMIAHRSIVADLDRLGPSPAPHIGLGPRVVFNPPPGITKEQADRISRSVRGRIVPRRHQ